MGMSQHAACEDVNIHHTMYGVWAKKTQEMQHARNNKARSLCPGPPSVVLQPMQDELLRFIFELREQGMPVSISMVASRASQLSPAFSQKSRTAKSSAARRFVRSHSLVHRLGTHESQRSPAETAADAMDFMTTVARPKVLDQAGVNKPFKDRIRRQWEEWMINEGILTGTTTPPTRGHIVQWTLNAMNGMSHDIVFNAWRHGRYTWFPTTAPPAIENN